MSTTEETTLNSNDDSHFDSAVGGGPIGICFPNKSSNNNSNNNANKNSGDSKGSGVLDWIGQVCTGGGSSALKQKERSTDFQQPKSFPSYELIYASASSDSSTASSHQSATGGSVPSGSDRDHDSVGNERSVLDDQGSKCSNNGTLEKKSKNLNVIMQVEEYNNQDKTMDETILTSASTETSHGEEEEEEEASAYSGTSASTRTMDRDQALSNDEDDYDSAYNEVEDSEKKKLEKAKADERLRKDTKSNISNNDDDSKNADSPDHILNEGTFSYDVEEDSLHSSVHSSVRSSVRSSVHSSSVKSSASTSVYKQQQDREKVTELHEDAVELSKMSSVPALPPSPPRVASTASQAAAAIAFAVANEQHEREQVVELDDEAVELTKVSSLPPLPPSPLRESEASVVSSTSSSHANSSSAAVVVASQRAREKVVELNDEAVEVSKAPSRPTSPVDSSSAAAAVVASQRAREKVVELNDEAVEISKAPSRPTSPLADGDETNSNGESAVDENLAKMMNPKAKDLTKSNEAGATNTKQSWFTRMLSPKRTIDAVEPAAATTAAGAAAASAAKASTRSEDQRNAKGDAPLRSSLRSERSTTPGAVAVPSGDGTPSRNFAEETDDVENNEQPSNPSNDENELIEATLVPDIPKAVPQAAVVWSDHEKDQQEEDVEAMWPNSTEQDVENGVSEEDIKTDNLDDAEDAQEADATKRERKGGFVFCCCILLCLLLIGGMIGLVFGLRGSGGNDDRVVTIVVDGTPPFSTLAPSAAPNNVKEPSDPVVASPTDPFISAVVQEAYRLTLVVSEQEDFSLAEIETLEDLIEGYTDDFAPEGDSVTTWCRVDKQTSSDCPEDNDSLCSVAGNEGRSYVSLKDVDFVCRWSSTGFELSEYPDLFVTFMTTNSNRVTEDLIVLGLPVINALPVKSRFGTMTLPASAP